MSVADQILAEAVKVPGQETDTEAPVVELELGGRKRKLQINLNVLIRIEELTGKGFMKGEIFKMSAKDMRAFIWACIAEDDPQVTLREVGAMLDMGNIAEVMEVIPQLLATWQSDDSRMLAPFVPTPLDVMDRALDMCQIKPGEKLYDLGAGDGRVLLAGLKKGAVVCGCEISLERFAALEVLIKSQDIGDRAVVLNKSIQEIDLSDADVVFVYLLTTSNSAIREQLEKQLKKGCRVVSHDFQFNDWKLVDQDAFESEGRIHSIYLYKIGEHYVEGLVQ